MTQLAKKNTLPKDFCVDLLCEFNQELENIASWWLERTVDKTNGGFYGEVDYSGMPIADANKGLVLNARILWFFSELALTKPEPAYVDAANRAYEYLQSHFYDEVNGGYWWELSSAGTVINTRKQVYGQAFIVYAYSSYYLLSKNERVLEYSMAVFKLIQAHAIDHDKKGFLEAFTEDWSPIQDFRLSEKDLNFPKTMNTHLHVLEAYSSLHRVANSEQTADALRYSLDVMIEHVFDWDTKHLKMFLDEHWNDHSPYYSYGHDIEASWLLWEAAEVLGDSDVKAQLHQVCIELAHCCLNEAITETGALVDERHIESGKVSVGFPWWVQAEALVGFMNAYELSERIEFINTIPALWNVVKSTILDKEAGEWRWFAVSDSLSLEARRIYKAGAWKAPYHNGRAMLEMSRRLERLLSDDDSAVKKSA